MKKFECIKCSACCRCFKDTERDIDGLPLFEWEKEELEQIAEERGIELNFKAMPLNTFKDKRSGIIFSSLFGMFNDPCPFLKNNQCSIYDKRPLICKQFPLNYTPEFSKDGIFGADCFIKCQNFDSKKQFEEIFKVGGPIKVNEIKKYLKDTYGSCYNSAFHSNYIGQFIGMLLANAVQDKRIKLRKVSRSDIAKANAVPFFEFLVRIGIVSEEEKERTLKKIKDFNEIKRLIDSASS